MDKPNILPAKEDEVGSVLGILNEAAEWLSSMGLPSQWRIVNLSRESFLDQTRRGEVFLARLGKETVGTITLQWSDLVFWKDALPDAGYVHKLAVRRAYAGRGFGLAMLEWAEKGHRLPERGFYAWTALLTIGEYVNIMREQGSDMSEMFSLSTGRQVSTKSRYRNSVLLGGTHQ